jgi:hypothetical protein
MQNGMPIVKLKKNGRWKNLPGVSPSFLGEHVSLPSFFNDMISAVF